MPSLKRIFGKKMPIPIPAELANDTTLLAHLGVGAQELKKIWFYREKMYETFDISKNKGKVRQIAAPDKRLKFLQRTLAPLLEQLYRIRNPVHGFVSERSVKTNALAHEQRRFVVNLDLEDFFPTITEKRIRGLLDSLGVDGKVGEIIARICCVHGHLPQGAPTSPVLSNMICFRLDSDLMQVAKNARAIYTRYADDITFSSFQPPVPLFDGAMPSVGRFSPDLLAPDLRAAITTNGFRVNADKTHYADRNSRRIVTGVKINEGLNVDRRYVRRVRAILHSIERIGLEGAQEKYVEVGGRGSVEAHLRGKISYIAHLKGQTDPVVRSLALRFNANFPSRPIKLIPTAEEQRDRSVWVIDNDDNQGTAFFLAGIGLVTAAHCAKDLEEVKLLHPSKHSTTFNAKVIKRDDHRDLAILDHAEIPATEHFELEPGISEPAVGEQLTAFGFPDWAPGDQLNQRPGHVTLITPQGGVRKIEVTQELTQGMSGGPILNSEGLVVGIIHKGGPDEGRQLAISIPVLHEWLAE